MAVSTGSTRVSPPGSACVNHNVFLSVAQELSALCRLRCHLQREDVLPAVVADLEDARLRCALLPAGHPVRQPLLQLDAERHQDGHLQTESRF